jgi:phytoene synthase
VASEANIPASYPSDVIDGFALDTIGFSPRTEQELYRYCYHVAGAVGCMMAIVMGVPADAEDTLDRACDLGIAFQLANIARDITEDAAAGRCYLPRDWLDELEIPREQMLDPAYRPRLAELADRLAERAGAYEASARYGAGSLSFRSAWAVLAAAGIYGEIAREVKRRGASAWDQRVTISKTDKLGWAILAGIQARTRASCPDPGRDGLWNRITLRSATR